MADVVADTLFPEETSDTEAISNEQAPAETATGETPKAATKVEQQPAPATPVAKQDKAKASKGTDSDKAPAKTTTAQPATPPAAQPVAEDAEDEAEEPDVDELIYDNWLLKQPPQVQEMIERQQRALRAALVDERGERKKLGKQLRDLEKKASTEQVTAEELNKLRATLSEAQRQAKFYESVPGDCNNPKLAYLAALNEGLVTEGGKTNWEGLRDAAPQLFQKVTVPSANAGTGARQEGAAGQPNMNNIIRNLTGRN